MIDIIEVNNIKSRYSNNVKVHIMSATKVKKDCKGTEYIDDYKYINNMKSINDKIFNVIINEPAIVGKLITYIIHNLTYNTDNIILKPTEIATELHEDRSNIAKGLKRLKELNIVTRAIDIPEMQDKVNNKYLYFINSNYIFYGKVEQLYNDWNQQYGDNEDE